MDRQQQQQNEPRSSGGNSSSSTRRSREHSKKRLPEPPKFYSKNYLRRYNHGEVKSNSTIASGSQQQNCVQQNGQTSGKKIAYPSTTDQGSRQQQQHKISTSTPGSSDAAVIGISTTILKLGDDGVETLTPESTCSNTTPINPCLIGSNVINNSNNVTPACNNTPTTSCVRNEPPVNPYNRAPYNARSNSRGGTRQDQDHRYSLSNAMSSVKSSYFKFGSAIPDSEPDPANEPFSYTPQPVVQQQQQRGAVEAAYGELSRQENFKRIKSKVEEAVKRHKIFLIRGELPRLKEALEERGWIQKYEPSRTRSLPYGSSSGAMEAKSLGDVRAADGTLNERPLVYTLLQNVQPDFIWDCRNDFHEWDRSIGSNVLLNRFSKPSLYTSKLGMAHVLQEAHWMHETDVADVLFPRSYNPSRELAALSRDFQRCAALAVLRCFVDRMRNSEEAAIPTTTTTTTTNITNVMTNGTTGIATGTSQLCNERDKMNEPIVSLDWIEFAIRCCEDHIAELEHEDIDIEMDNEISPEDWRLFTDDCEKYLYRPGGMANFPTTDPDRLEACYVAAQSALEKLRNMDPQFNLNGERNIWIVKPSNLCCGTGIFMTHDLKTILRKVESKPRDYYVVQKYIERPFLVYGTKFDIRQWFLVTSTFPMTIWSFREALLRLSSKPYTPSTYHEAIHLCNTAVQEKYDWDRRRRRNRAAAVAAAAAGGGTQTQMQTVTQPMDDFEPTVRDQGWDCEKLNEYLKGLGYEGEPYYERIYPKMSQAIVLTMLAAQDFMDRRRCSFELYGADFMVMEDLSVWLIEINTNPRMHPPSSRITQRLYGSVLDSLIKVVMDLPLNPNADTGGFELVYRQSVPETAPYLGPCLFALGKSMCLHEAPPRIRRTQQQQPPCCTGSNITTCSNTNTTNNTTCPSGNNPNSPGPWAKQFRAWTAPPMVERLREPKVVDFIACLNNAAAASSNTTPAGTAVTPTTTMTTTNGATGGMPMRNGEFETEGR